MAGTEKSDWNPGAQGGPTAPAVYTGEWAPHFYKSKMDFNPGIGQKVEDLGEEVPVCFVAPSVGLRDSVVQ